MPGKIRARCPAQGFERIAGVDEVGRGALFGPVFAAAVILSPDRPLRGLRDSKLLDRERREILAVRIRERAIAWAVAAIDAFEIDRINILQASRLAMRRAIEQLNPAADYLLVDAVKVDLPSPSALSSMATRYPNASPLLRFWPRWSATPACANGMWCSLSTVSRIIKAIPQTSIGKR